MLISLFWKNPCYPWDPQKKYSFFWGHPVQGKNVPFWFPGLVREQSKKGYFKIDFLADFGQEICPISNIMQFKDFNERKKQEKTSKLFNIPKRFALNYENALVVARSHKSDDWFIDWFYGLILSAYISCNKYRIPIV